ncbi:uncharacterized protein LOC123219914 [Mangifera indica]|uniref:uncharacterized protein LOC123219914 n=1 Tax=Mangifera indica TaxID=29780 RepID=UPI001CFA4487|nr:uncharacterized protein LOC123219914 [Mangifera indica]XP_044497818.1 uncharacterized protein LOC123219914 [Mangifera indica]
MESTAHADYAAFEDKVRRTVYLDNLSPQVTKSVLKTALDQFGSVQNVQFIPNYIESRTARCALVEMKNSKEAKAVISTMSEFPFMMSGMPRPVRARAAEMEMFDDRPSKPGRKIICRWLDPTDPDYDVAQKLKRLVRQHDAQSAFLLKQQLAQEEKLAKNQEEVLKANYKKYEMVEGVLADGTARRLAREYDLRISDD